MSRIRPNTTFVLSAAITVVVAVALYFTRSLWPHTPSFIAGVLTVLAAAILLLHHRRFYASPIRQLSHLLDEIRAGRSPIDEISSFNPRGLRFLIPSITELLHEVRRRQREVAELNAEISQRVANRTDALERNLSSMRIQSQCDPLTGLFNRRALDQAFPRIIEKCRASQTDLFVLMIDLDRFKLVNDTLGHAAGDTFLSDIGNLIRSAIRPTDFAFRYGGDEFVILLPGVNRQAARAMADRLTQLGAQLGKTLRTPLPPGLTVGTSSLHANPASTPTELLKLADSSLYAIKPSRRSA